MPMSPQQHNKCSRIIHTAATASGLANLSPVPGTGVAADMVAMTTMAVGLAGVFGGNLSEEAARGIAYAAIKNTLLRQPIRALAREFSRLVPGLGQLVAPTISILLIEAAGWAMAEELSARRQLPWLGDAA